MGIYGLVLANTVHYPPEPAPHLSSHFVTGHHDTDALGLIPKPCVAGSNPAGGARPGHRRWEAILTSQSGQFRVVWESAGNPTLALVGLPSTPCGGHLEERGKNTWRAKVFLGNDADTGNKRYVTRTIHGTKRQAETVLNELLVEVGQNGDAIVDRTFQELSQRWIALSASALSPTTLAE